MLEEYDQFKLLKKREVVEEINRHLWLESEKAGYDIGFEKAAEDWLKRFSQAWMAYHSPQESKSSTSESLIEKLTSFKSKPTRKKK